METVSNEKGLALIIAVVILLIFAIISSLLASLVSNDSDMALYQFRASEATYIANGGMQYAMMNYYPLYPGFSIPPYSLRGGTPQINIGSGGFTVDPSGVLSAAINNVVTTIPAFCFDRGAVVNCDTIFPPAGRILIQSELIDYAGVTPISFTVATRGVGGSVSAAHAIDQGIYHAKGLT